ncbi:MAG: ATPase, T2SS/T4P/T4SS family [Acidobacteriota bacterium]
MEEYLVECWSCLAEYDALSAVWCGCDPKNPSKLCPFCLQCFCQAPSEFKDRFWSGATPSLRQDLAVLAKSRERLGDMLIRAHLLTTDQLLSAIKEQNRSGDKIGEVLIRLGYISRSDLDHFLSRQETTHSTDLSKISPNMSLIKDIGLEFCRQKRIVPIERENLQHKQVLTVAMADPGDTQTKDQLREKTGCQIIALSAPASQVTEFLRTLPSPQQPDLSTTRLPPAEESEAAEAEESPSAAPVAVRTGPAYSTLDVGIEAPPKEDLDRAKKIINQLIVGAVQRGASDLHLEPTENGFTTHYRIDGVLFKVRTPPGETPQSMVWAVKDIAGLDLKKTDVPQDGKVFLKIKEVRYKLIVHTFPTEHGENVSVKIIDRDTFVKDIYQLGMDESVLSDLLFSLGESRGLVLLSAPLFSGVSTTQYALMSYLARSQKKVATLENPIICPVEGIRQSEIKPEAGYDFAKGLNAMVSSYPDAIVISELRDLETATAVCRIASKILVLAALEANSAAETIGSVLDLGVPASALASALSVVANQRLLRKICPHCLVPQAVEKSEANLLGLDSQETASFKFFHGKGCPKCNSIGYRGRIAIFELMKVDDEMKKLVRTNPSADQIQKVAVASGMRSLKTDCIEKLRNGHTTLEEFVKASFD